MATWLGLASVTAGCETGAGFLEDNLWLVDSETEPPGSDSGADDNDPEGPGQIVGLWRAPDPKERVLRFADDGVVSLASSEGELDSDPEAVSTMKWLMSEQTLSLVSLTGMCTEAGNLRLGEYTFKVTSKRLILSLVKDECPARRAIGEIEWKRVNP